MAPCRPPLLALPLLLILAIAPSRVAAHGLMVNPPQRGTMSDRQEGRPHPFVVNKFDLWQDSATDTRAHFPAGDKSLKPGAALRSQRRYAGSWNAFKPLSNNFRWRAGVCGDHRRRYGKDPPQDHMRGGKYYYGGQITRTYVQGSIVSFHTSVVAHHNGFFEFHICNVAKCGGEISESCFRKGHCYPLKRARTAVCESRKSMHCGPIDPKYPGRWYLPCARVDRIKPRPNGPTFNYYGGRYMRYHLPDKLKCEHCVLHWFWSAANTCNPPGVRAYFNGKRSPLRWGQCPGQGGARGGLAAQQADCAPKVFPEEYYTCADVRIVPKGASTKRRISRKVFSHLVMIKRNKSGQPVAIRRMNHKSSHGFRFKRGDAFNIEAVALRRPIQTGVHFYTRGFRNKRWERLVKKTVDTRRPFFIRPEQSGRMMYWSGVYEFRTFVVVARSSGQEIRVRIRMRMG